jgi:hypothetical protein
MDVSQSRSGYYGEEKSLASAGNWTPAAQSIARRCIDWAIPTPVAKTNKKINV